MKKYIYLAIALVMGVFSSCTDKDDIEIIMHHDVVLNINTQKMYEQWGINNYTTFLGSNKSYGIGVTSFVYSEDGSLVASASNTISTFQNVSQTFRNIEDGKYTVITIETMANLEDEEKPAKYEFEGIDNIDSLRIVTKGRSQITWPYVIGKTINKIELKKSDVVDITPQPVGALIEFAYSNFEKSHYNYLALAVKNQADGLYLSDSKDIKYYYKEYLPQNTWPGLGYFHSYDDVIPAKGNQTFYTFETGNRMFLFGGAKDMWVNGNLKYDYTTNNFAFNIEDGVQYCAYCYYKGKPTVLDTFLGTFEDWKTWYVNLDRAMNPIYKDPCTTWGSTVSYVKSFMKGYEILKDIEEGPYSYYMSYKGNYCENYIQYDFETKTTGLFSSSVCVLEEEATENDILSMLNETQYEYDQYYEEFGYHLYFDDKTYVVVTPNLSYDDGTGYTKVQYLSRAVADAESSAAKARNIATSNRKSRIPAGLLKTNLKNVKKNK